VREGKLIADKPIDQITAGLPKHIKVVSKDNDIQTKITKLKGVSHVKSKNTTLTCQYLGDINQLVQFLSKHSVDDLSIAPPDLDTIFTMFYEDK